MRLHSNRDRPHHLGPLPLERLARDPAAPDVSGALPGDDAPPPGRDSVAHVIPEYTALFAQLLDGGSAPARAPVPDDPTVRADNLKATAYFLDAIAAGCCAVADADRTAAPPTDLPPLRFPPHPAAIEGMGRSWRRAFRMHQAAATPDDFTTRLFELRSLELWLLKGRAMNLPELGERLARATALRDGILAELRTRFPPSQRHALVFLVEDSREPRDGEPGHDWIRGAGSARSDLRAGEIAAVLAGYLRWLGFSARGHFGAASCVDLARLAVRAGLCRRGDDGRLTAPLLPRGFRVGAVTTDYALAPDLPLAPTGPLVPDDPALLEGVGGTRPGRPDDEADRRPLHLGAWPMEEIPRSDEPTTLILRDQIARVPKRGGDFFKRAEAGDLGELAQREIKRFAFKHPLSLGMLPLLLGMVPGQGTRTPLAPTGVGGDLSDPRRNADAIKALAHFLGADFVGICRAEPWMYYSTDETGPISAYHPYAVVMLIDQGFETMEGASGDDWISATQSMRAYVRGAAIAGVMAAHCRRMGYSARSHTNAHSDVIHNPAILMAGLGEVSRIGETLLNPFIGPRSKSVVFTTDLPLAVDRPIDFGLQDFCAQCRKCARECPCNAIPYGPKIMFNGYETWKADVDKCTRYRLTQARGSACGRCMKTCPWNREDTTEAREMMWLSIRSPSARRQIIAMDDLQRNGARNPIKRWWFDLEMVDGVCVVPRAGVNERDLSIGRDEKLAPRQRLALFPPSLLPPDDARMDEPHPIDRAAGVAAYAAAPAPPPRRGPT